MTFKDDVTGPGDGDPYHAGNLWRHGVAFTAFVAGAAAYGHGSAIGASGGAFLALMPGTLILPLITTPLVVAGNFAAASAKAAAQATGIVSLFRRAFGPKMGEALADKIRAEALHGVYRGPPPKTVAYAWEGEDASTLCRVADPLLAQLDAPAGVQRVVRLHDDGALTLTRKVDGKVEAADEIPSLLRISPDGVVTAMVFHSSPSTQAFNETPTDGHGSCTPVMS